MTRPRAGGKFIFVGEEKLYLRGATYGPFRPEADGSEYHTPEIVHQDFALMQAHGVNAVRTYTVPPDWLLDAAHQHGLYVLVGFPWEQHITFLDDPQRVLSIEEGIRDGVRACADHPAVLGYTIGNEIPASIVRWYGPERMARFLERLYRAAKEEDPGGLVSYVNYPTTEYLQHYLPFLDFVCFNVYLENREPYEAYLARVQNLAGDRPLVMTEIGLDSRRNGTDRQAHTLDWQVRSTFAAGYAGAFVFSWTDEWFRGGCDIDDWDFGLTDRQRRPKPALAAVADAFADVPFPVTADLPRFSVVVCSYNGAKTIRDTLDALQRLAYPNVEVIVVDDGSTDETAAIARTYDVHLIRTENQGLSAARNTGMEAATGDIIAYLDDDAYPDPHWLNYLAGTFTTTDHVAVGGPNIAPPGDGLIAAAVNHAPGNPIHVLYSDREAEHIPGCNMVIRKDALQAVGGFDTRFRIAGDDVDLCWRLQQQGGTIGYNPAAMVWHHRRRSIRTFWRQQKNYGKAEAVLEMKWPEKYNQLGHLRWHGRVYNGDLAYFSAFTRWRVYHGTWGTSPFQQIRSTVPHVFETLPLTPEWYLLIIALAVVSAIGFFWAPLLWALAPLALALGSLFVQAIRSALRVDFHHAAPRDLLPLRLLTTYLHLMQPMARLLGRLRFGLTPWRKRGISAQIFPWPRRIMFWSEQWHAPETWLLALTNILKNQGTILQHGSGFDRWDLEVRGGLFGAARLLMTIEEHGSGKQLLRFRSWPQPAPLTQALVILFGSLSFMAVLHLAWPAIILLSLIAVLCMLRGQRDCAAAQAALHQAIDQLGETGPSLQASQ